MVHATPEPGHWYAQIGHDITHSLSTSAPRSTCDTVDIDTITWRPAEVGDRVCAECVAGLRAAQAGVYLPLPVCLGCFTLQPTMTDPTVVPPSAAPLVVSAHDERGHEPPRPCAGVGIQSASHDGRDVVRHAAAIQRASVRAKIDAMRTQLENDMQHAPIGEAIADNGRQIMFREGELELWNELVTNGSYLATMATAVITMAIRPYLDNGLEEALILGRVRGARAWLQAAQPILQDEMHNPETDLATYFSGILSEICKG